ncbi:MAG TPA: hypothetical protein VFN87_21675 [Solirubrobacteraceae bacterium]|nr:hypothetical protein [Solirubrobacteraceae bacterium]
MQNPRAPQHHTRTSHRHRELITEGVVAGYLHSLSAPSRAHARETIRPRRRPDCAPNGRTLSPDAVRRQLSAGKDLRQLTAAATSAS